MQLEQRPQPTLQRYAATDVQNSVFNQSSFEADETESDSFKDFQDDPAHLFWTWDQTKEQWFHQDKDTGLVIWCPTELD
ncbi:hypothetical protein CGMCC3_g7897 [Colletotrichum fructicola]|nr:uncharacterized protein CGMCC3_g7897 [Colletotrichum fructicola]KAE9576161.1 hypothetical protein CGMCC3_g7897 [Colletotrichum fructicola]